MFKFKFFLYNHVSIIIQSINSESSKLELLLSRIETILTKVEQQIQQNNFKSNFNDNNNSEEKKSISPNNQKTNNNNNNYQQVQKENPMEIETNQYHQPIQHINTNLALLQHYNNIAIQKSTNTLKKIATHLKYKDKIEVEMEQRWFNIFRGQTLI